MPNIHYRTMRKHIFTGVLFLLITITTNAQMIRIESQTGYEICSGYSPNSLAHVCLVSGLPRVPDNAYATYTWIVKHANGTRVWNTDRGERSFQLPWPGLYTVQVRIEMMHKNRPWAFQVLWSNRIEIRGINCESPS